MLVMKRSVLILIMFCLSLGVAFSQGYQWGKRIGSYGIDFGYATTMDPSGNVIMAGQFEFNGYFDGFNNVNLVCKGQHDAFVAKYNPQGILQWVKGAGGKGGDNARAVCTDAVGNIYITGEMEDTMWFDNISLIAAGSNDIYIAKYNPSGVVQWAVRAGGYSGDRGRGIVVDGAGMVYITGEYRSTATFGSITVGPAAGTYKDYFVAKYNPAAGWEWVRTGASSVDDQGQAICLDNNGNVYTTGYFGPNASFGSTNLNTTNGTGFDLFVAKYTTAGSPVWIQRAGGQWDDYGAGMIYSAADQRLYVTGEYRGTADFGTITSTELGWGDIFLAAYDPAGGVLWLKTAGGSGATDYAKAIALDGTSNIYITGAVGKSTMFDATALTTDTSDVFIASYNSSGSLRWVTTASGSGPEDRGNGIAVNGTEIYVIGNYNENGGTPTAEMVVGNTHLMGMSHEDAYILRYSQTIAGIQETPFTDITFYPNPANELLTIVPDVSGELLIENEIGEIVYENTVTANVQELVDVSSFAHGMYFVRFGNHTQKLIKN
jgi:hypothetical protein